MSATNDAAYQSLRRLLLASPVNQSHIDLLDRNALYGSIGHFLSSMSLLNVTDFTEALIRSPALWNAPAFSDVNASTQQAVERATGIAQALSFAVSERVTIISKALRRAAPRSAPAELGAWLQAILEGVHRVDHDVHHPHHTRGKAVPTTPTASMSRAQAPPHPSSSVPRTYLAKLATVTGLVHGVLSERNKRTRFSLWFHLGRHTRTLEHAWAAVLTDALQKNSYWDVASRTASLTLAASVVDMVSEASMRTVSDKIWIEAAMPLVLDVFDVERATSTGLFCDASPDARGIVSLPAHGTSDAWRSRVQSHPLYAHAGPLARLLASAIRRLGAATSPQEFIAYLWGHQDDAEAQAPFPPMASSNSDASDPGRSYGMLRRWFTGSVQLDDAWTSSALAGLETAHIEPASRERTTQIWQVFKTYLFTLTLVLDAVVGIIVEQCPSPTETYPPATDKSECKRTNGEWPAMPTSNVPEPYLDALAHVLRIFERVYWITSTFGLDGFESYRVVFYSALDVLSRDASACTQVVSSMAHDLLQRHKDVPGGRPAAHVSFAQRMHVTYFLLVMEQWVAELPHAMLEQLGLPMCRPYLEDTRFQDTFESAHSVVLALYACGASCTRELTPFYVDLLLTCFPKQQLSASQLEVALMTIVQSLSDRSDSLAWWCIARVDDQVSIAQLQGRHDVAETLAVCLAALVPHVNLILLRALLSKVDTRIREQPAGSSARARLVERVFESLGDMDAATRPEALLWWLDKGPLLTQGMS